MAQPRAQLGAEVADWRPHQINSVDDDRAAEKEVSEHARWLASLAVAEHLHALLVCCKKHLQR
eukprot:4446574-Pleurochrysis_carterae.AAC.1